MAQPPAFDIDTDKIYRVTITTDRGQIVAEGPPVQVLTGTQISAHYGAHVDVIHHRGQPVVVPLRTPDRGASHART